MICNLQVLSFRRRRVPLELRHAARVHRVALYTLYNDTDLYTQLATTALFATLCLRC